MVSVSVTTEVTTEVSVTVRVQAVAAKARTNASAKPVVSFRFLIVVSLLGFVGKTLAASGKAFLILSPHKDRRPC